MSSARKRLFLDLGAPALAFAALVGAMLLPRAAPAAKSEGAARVVRVGYMPNLTHAQAVAGARRGDFARALDGVAVEFRAFNAGPALVEALFAGEIDLAYVGPSPAVNAHAKSGGEDVRVISGAAANGAAVVVRPGAGIARPEDLLGKRIATPQYGNTQDVAARHYVTQVLKGSLDTTRIVNTENPDILALLRRGDVDAAWVPEPWAARLVAEAGGTILFEEKSLWPDARFATVNVVARRAFLEANRDLVKRFLAAHDALTDWLNARPGEAMQEVNAGLKAITGKALPPDILRDAWGRVSFTTDPLFATTAEQARRAHAIGHLKSPPDLSRLLVEGLR